MKSPSHARKAAAPAYRKLICHGCALGLFSPTVAPVSGWKPWQMRPGRLSKTPPSLTRMQDKRAASLMDSSGSYLPLRRTITKIFPRYLAGHFTKLSSFMMLIFPLSRQLQIQTALSVWTYCTHTDTQKPIFLPVPFTGMFLLMVVAFWIAPKCLYKSHRDSIPPARLAFGSSNTELCGCSEGWTGERI